MNETVIIFLCRFCSFFVIVMDTDCAVLCLLQRVIAVGVKWTCYTDVRKILHRKFKRTFIKWGFTLLPADMQKIMKRIGAFLFKFVFQHPPPPSKPPSLQKNLGTLTVITQIVWKFPNLWLALYDPGGCCAGCPCIWLKYTEPLIVTS